MTPAAFSVSRTAGVVLLGPSSKVRQTHFSGTGSSCGNELAGAASGAGEAKPVSGTGVRSLSWQPGPAGTAKNSPSPKPAAAPARSRAAPRNKIFPFALSHETISQTSLTNRIGSAVSLIGYDPLKICRIQKQAEELTFPAKIDKLNKFSVQEWRNGRRAGFRHQFPVSEGSSPFSCIHKTAGPWIESGPAVLFVALVGKHKKSPRSIARPWTFFYAREGTRTPKDKPHAPQTCASASSATLAQL